MGIINRFASMFQKHAETVEGYEHPDLIDVIFQKTVAFTASTPWDELDGTKTVLDFGGACGVHYKQAQLPNVRWAVVDTPAMAARARELETNCLRFFSDIQSASSWLGDIDAMHSNGALQYTPNPLETLKELCGLKAKTMLWKRTRLGKATSSSIQISRLIDNGPGKIADMEDKPVKYRETVIAKKFFLDCHRNYILTDRVQNDFRFSIK